nr:unnamed protein product [Trichobilharzia regenti]
MEVTVNSPSRTAWCHQLGEQKDLWGEWINHRQKHLMSSVSQQNSSKYPTANFSQTCFFSHHLVNIGPYNHYDYHHADSNRRTNLILISLNGLIWYQGNRLAGNTDNDPLGQLEWLQKTFRWARRHKAKVLLVSHFPPGASENAPAGYRFLRPEINDRFVNILIYNADLLMAGLFAHEHVDSFRLLVSKSNISVASLFLMPSVSPMILHGLGDFNPRIRLYRYQRSTMKLLGYAQYYYNLENQLSPTNDHNNNNNNWQLEYDTLSAYQLVDLSPQSLTNLYHNFLQEDNGYWSSYWRYELGGRQHALKPNYLNKYGLCPRAYSQCRCDHLCAMRNLFLNNLDKCLQLCQDIKYTYGTTANSHSLLLDNPMLTVIAKHELLTGDNATSYPNQSIINQTSVNNTNERSSLPYIIGVIIAFLVILIGIILIVNREVCNRHRGYHHQHRSLLASMISVGGVGGAAAAAAAAAGGLNGGGLLKADYLQNNTSRSIAPPGIGDNTVTVNDCGMIDHYGDYGIGGSCIELRTAFHPAYDDFDVEYFNKSMLSLNGEKLGNIEGNNADDDDDLGDGHHHHHQKETAGVIMMNYHGGEQQPLHNSIVNGVKSCKTQVNGTILSPGRILTAYYANHHPSSTTTSSSCSGSQRRGTALKHNNNNIDDKRYSISDYAYIKNNYLLSNQRDHHRFSNMKSSHPIPQSPPTAPNHIPINTSIVSDNPGVAGVMMNSRRGESLLGDERSNTTTSEMLSQSEQEPHQQTGTSTTIISCLPEDYYADDEAAFGDDDDRSELNDHHHRHRQPHKDDYSRGGIGGGDRGRIPAVDDKDSMNNSVFSTTGHDHPHNCRPYNLNIGKKLKTKLKSSNYPTSQRQYHPYHHNDENDCNTEVENDEYDDTTTNNNIKNNNNDDLDSLSDEQAYHFDQESQLLDNDAAATGNGKLSKDWKFTFLRSKVNEIDALAKQGNHSSPSASSFTSHRLPNQHLSHSQSAALSEAIERRKVNNQYNNDNHNNNNVGNLLTSSLICLPNESNGIQSKGNPLMMMNRVTSNNHHSHGEQQKSHSTYASPVKHLSGSRSPTKTTTPTTGGGGGFGVVNPRHQYQSPVSLNPLGINTFPIESQQYHHQHQKPNKLISIGSRKKSPKHTENKRTLMSVQTPTTSSSRNPPSMHSSSSKIPGYDYVRMSS